MVHQPNPILLEVTRGGRVESFHRGRFALVNTQGEPISSMGASSEDCYPRSSIKLLQAAAMMQVIQKQALSLKPEQIAIGAGSHDGLAVHTDVVSRWLEQMSLQESHLRCGLHQPYAFSAQQSLSRQGGQLSTLHNNCSGKHALMLQSAQAMGATTENYIDMVHPVQQHIAEVLSRWCDWDLTPERGTLDGCGVPLYAMPLERLARAYARFGRAVFAASKSASASAAAMRSVAEAIWACPQMIAGPERFCTQLTQAMQGTGLGKLGAQGVYSICCNRFALTLKIDDGNNQAAEIVAAKMMAELMPDHDWRSLNPKIHPTVKTLDGRWVGEYRLSAALQDTLQSVRFS